MYNPSAAFSSTTGSGGGAGGGSSGSSGGSGAASGAFDGGALSPTPQYIYHEKQESLLCGQHALNNLLQGTYFTSADLAAIALELDERERALMFAEGVDTPEAIAFAAEDSGNVDEYGNFSVSVLQEAVQRSHGLSLDPTDERVQAVLRDPTCEEAYVLNHSSHWLTVRRLHGQYWDLNSMNDRPEHITDFHLGAFLAQLHAEGYSIFSVRGDLPPPVRDPALGKPGCLYTVAELAGAAAGGSRPSGGTTRTRRWRRL